MGKSELLMLLAGITLSILIALVTIPTFTKGSDVAKISLINSDISSIRKVGEMYIQSKSTKGDFNGINAEQVSQFIPSLKSNGIGVNYYFKSSANENIKYIIGTIPPNNDILVFRIEGLLNIDGSKESILKNQEKLNINTNTTPANKDVVELHFKG